MRSIKRMTLILFTAMLASSALAAPASAQAQPGDVTFDSPIRSFTLSPTEARVDMDVDFINNVNERRIVNLTLEGVPEGWDVDLWNQFFDFRITELVVDPVTDDNPGQRPVLRIVLPDPRPAPGNYSFTLVVSDAQEPGVIYERAEFTVGVPEGAPEDIGEVTLRSEFPNLQGPPGTAFEFEVIIKNDTDEERSVALEGTVLDANGQPVQGWDLGFVPAFGEETRISSVAIQPQLEERVNVQVSPLGSAAPGDYFIPIAVSANEGLYTDEEALALRITGRGELIASTESGRLSMDATAGDPSKNVLRLTNVGTADLTSIALSSDKPADWEVTYQIDNVEALGVNQRIDIAFDVTPPGDAIPGDYEITLRGRTGNAEDAVTVRVTVDQSTIWGWLGIVLVIVVVGALIGLFWRLGRR